jgi:hypothetical protein
MKHRGFVVNNYLSKVAKMMQEKGVDVLLVDTDGEGIAHLAAAENRIMLTDNLKLFNAKSSIPRVCLHYKAKPFSNIQSFFD